LSFENSDMFDGGSGTSVIKYIFC